MFLKEIIMLFFILLFGFSSLAIADTIGSSNADNPTKANTNTVGSHQYGERRRVVKPAPPPPQTVIVVPTGNSSIKPNSSGTK